MDNLLQDIRYALRMMLKQPSVPLLALIALALGIGATTAIFSVINSVLFKPLPYPNHERLVQVWEKRPALGRIRNVASAPDFFDWKTQNSVFEDMAAYLRTDATLGGSDSPEQIPTAAISPGLFSILQVKPRLGRPFEPDEDQIGRHRVALISDGVWKFRWRPSCARESLPPRYRAPASGRNNRPGSTRYGCDRRKSGEPVSGEHRPRCECLFAL
jgi:putative ABC transport system permease protein